MLKKRIPIGIEDYKEMIKDDFYYADKTLLIKELLDNKTKVFLMTRPRRFGKTLGLSTIQCFFEDERDAWGNKIDNQYYFNGKKIMDAGEEYVSHAGSYPVIKLSLKSAKQPDFETAYANLVKEIGERVLQAQIYHRCRCSKGGRKRRIFGDDGKKGRVSAVYNSSKVFIRLSGTVSWKTDDYFN